MGPVPHAVWVGCVVMPAGAGGNSITPLPGGGLIETDFIHKPNPHFLDDMENGAQTGGVLKWTPEAGWTEFTPIKMSGANGATVTPDGKWVFISEWSDYKIWKFALDGSVPPQSIHLNFLPDNLRLTDKGAILIAGQNADPINVMTCRSKHVPCQAPFTVLEMDPATMTTQVLARGGDEDFGGATGAAMVGSSLWISSYFSEKIAQVSAALVEPQDCFMTRHRAGLSLFLTVLMCGAACAQAAAPAMRPPPPNAVRGFRSTT